MPYTHATVHGAPYVEVPYNETRELWTKTNSKTVVFCNNDSFGPKLSMCVISSMAQAVGVAVKLYRLPRLAAWRTSWQRGSIKTACFLEHTLYTVAPVRSGVFLRGKRKTRSVHIYNYIGNP